ncbi:MAG: PAS domain S-box protein [Planctomycetes bacterium]|nr:PAS domain S-box protein [Planctomycetota bacterium]
MEPAAPSLLHLFSEVIQSVNLGNSLEEMLDLIYSRLREYVPYDRISVALTDEKKQRLTSEAVRAEGTILMNKGYGAPIAGSSLEPLLREGRTRILDDLQEYLAKKPTSESTRLIVKEGMRSSLTLPLLVQGQPIGVMFFSSRQPRTYQPKHEEFLRTIAGHVAIAVEKSRLMDALRHKSEYIETILQSSADGIIALDNDGRIQTWNEGARRIYGYTAEEAIGRPFEILVPAELQAAGELQKITEQVDRDGFIKDYETVRLTKDGRRVLVNVTATAMRNSQGRPLGRSAVHRNVTHLKKLQEDLARSQSLAAVGELSATIAHEIKNPLAGISGAIQVLQDAIPATDRRRFVVTEILEQIRRLDNTVHDLLTFARPMTPVMQTVAIGESLRRAWSLLCSQPGAKSVRFRIEGPEIQLQMDPHLMEQIWINLFQNAIEAMPQGGDLSVSVADGDPAKIAVRDGGTGIDPANLPKLFRPFFSTKTRGTGLGLAISKKIIEAHGGAIGVESARPRGTCVLVEIPR